MKGRWPDLARAFAEVEKSDAPGGGGAGPKKGKRRGPVEDFLQEFLEIREFLQKLVAGVESTIRHLEKARGSHGNG